jgi:hypothetical protein
VHVPPQIGGSAATCDSTGLLEQFARRHSLMVERIQNLHGVI